MNDVGWGKTVEAKRVVKVPNVEQEYAGWKRLWDRTVRSNNKIRGIPLG